MGINISVYRPDGTEHPTWDWSRCVGDREIPGILREIGFHACTGAADEPLVRPHDVTALWERLRVLPDNQERWDELCDILREPEWWLYFSL